MNANLDKHILITHILDNPVYMTNSDLYKSAYNGLMKLSKRQLGQIETIVDMKKTDYLN